VVRQWDEAVTGEVLCEQCLPLDQAETPCIFHQGSHKVADSTARGKHEAINGAHALRAVRRLVHVRAVLCNQSAPLLTQPNPPLGFGKPRKQTQGSSKIGS
jgi:hypothetical protein